MIRYFTRSNLIFDFNRSGIVLRVLSLVLLWQKLIYFATNWLWNLERRKPPFSGSVNRRVWACVRGSDRMISICQLCYIYEPLYQNGKKQITKQVHKRGIRLNVMCCSGVWCKVFFKDLFTLKKTEFGSDSKREKEFYFWCKKYKNFNVCLFFNDTEA